MGAQKKCVCVRMCVYVCIYFFSKVVGSQHVLHIQLNLIHVYGNRDFDRRRT